ncbi:MAG: lipocalin family protein [Oscillibacter sp.]|nr:lipocalin family protein [Oscillibacter sp.]
MKILKLLAVLWCAVIMSVSFTSCSKDDDDDDKDDKEESLLIGTWRDDTYDDEWDELTFKKDGSFTWTLYDEKDGTDVSTGTYTYKHPKLTLIFDEDEYYDDGEKEVYIVKSISSSKLVLYSEDEDETMTYSKK